MEDRAIRLWPIGPADHEFLYWLSTADQISYSWRFRGYIPSFEQFVAQLDAGVMTHFVVRSVTDGERIGYVVAYNGDQRNGHCYIASAMSPEKVGLGLGHRALALLIGHIFAGWRFNKLYAEVPDFIFDTIAGQLGDPSDVGFHVEGCLKKHLYAFGEQRDIYVVAMYRSDWLGEDAFLANWSGNHRPRVP